MRKLLLIPALAGLVILGCGKTAPAPAPSGTTVEDQKTIQGKWGIERFDLPPKDRQMGGPSQADVEWAVMEVVDSIVKGPLKSGVPGKLQYGVFKLDPAQNPKHFDLNPSDESGKPLDKAAFGREPETMKGIYKFEGDKLVVAFAAKGDAPRPTEFVAKDGPDGLRGQSVVVVTFKRLSADAQSKTPPAPSMTVPMTSPKR